MTTPPDATASESASCHPMGSLLRRTADGTANPVGRLLTRIHTLTCTGCRAHLADLRTTQTENPRSGS